MKDKATVHAVIRGRVQGVFFRMETKRAAERFGVSGWVKNLKDGTVEAVFEGERERIDAILDWCKQGPPHAHVENLDLKWDEFRGEYQGFEITF
jgi:acylphosphatase